jgi:hypothetical protein
LFSQGKTSAKLCNTGAQEKEISPQAQVFSAWNAPLQGNVTGLHFYTPAIFLKELRT